MTVVQRIDMSVSSDARGLLSAIQCPGELPFRPSRAFFVTKSPTGTTRGGHAHRTCEQFLVVLAGVVRVEYDDDLGTGALDLDSATWGLYIPPLAWAQQTYLGNGSSLAVLASHDYDVHDYVDERDVAAELRERAKSSRVLTELREASSAVTAGD